MTETITKPIWSTTGNPFVDMGQEMMAALVGVNYPSDLTVEDVKALLPRLVKLYFQKGWNSSLYNVFPNSELNNGKNLQEKYGKLLESWLYTIESDKTLGTSCAISGKPAQIKLGRKYLPLSDAEGRNFHSGNEFGLPLHASVALALQFFPLGLRDLGTMLALPHFSTESFSKKWADTSVNHVLMTEITQSKGILSAGTHITANAFFRLIELLVSDYQKNPDVSFAKTNVTLYRFKNFNKVDDPIKSPVLTIHYMPATVFSFIFAAMNPSVSDIWRKVVNQAYIMKKGKNAEGDDTILKNENKVYSNLLANKSISRFFIGSKENRPIASGRWGWLLYSKYLEEVQGMEPQRLKSLRDLGDRISPLIKEKRQYLYALERAKYKSDLVETLYMLTKISDNENPLVTFDQLITDVVPHDPQRSRDWNEVRYLLLFRIRENLHDELVNDPEYMEESENLEDESDE